MSGYAEQVAALRDAGFGEPLSLGGMFSPQAAPCLTCGALVPLLPVDDVAAPLPADHPVRVHVQWHADIATREADQ